ncbi:MAG: pyruvate formate lyase family protein [Chloroflexota bacterium]|nr:pyruvate formate lyase family protein [Chloroflexota bacterium]
MVQGSATNQDSQESWWWEAERNRSSRLDYLRKAVWSKGTTGGAYQPGVVAGLDRSYWYTKSHLKTQGKPEAERRALGLKEVLENMPIFIVDESQIVGYHAARPNELTWYTEFAYSLNEQIYHDPRQTVPEEEKHWVTPMVEYWRDKCVQVQVERYLTEEEVACIQQGPAMGWQPADSTSSSVVDYDYVFENGIETIIQKIAQKLDEAEVLLGSGPGTPDTLHLIEKVDQWRSMKIAAEAVITWANRYGRLAKIIAENFETDTKRKAELMKISEICAKVPARPVENLHEAVQCEHFVHVAGKWIDRPHAGWSQRTDQIYWPYYRRDVLEEKTMTRDEAVELMGENNLRIYEITAIFPWIAGVAFQGAPLTLPTLTLGGVDANGKDACNDLTEAILEACRLVRVGEPSYMFRYHPQARVSTLRACYETVRQGLGYPSFQHEGVSMDTLMSNYGATLEEARSYANVVCMSPGVVKGRGGQGIKYSGYIWGIMPMILALNDGFEPSVYGLQMGPHTGDPAECQAFEEFFDCWRQQFRHAYALATRVRTKARYVEARVWQNVFCSCLFERCVESGIDMVDARSQPLSNAWITLPMFADTVDCMYAIKKMIYDDKKYTMAELKEALAANWFGYAEMRQDFINVPKFGNDDEEADKVAAMCYQAVAEECGRNKEADGGKWMTLPENASAYAMGAMMPATPNGRRQGDLLYDGGISPGAGFDKKGPTAVLRSVSRIDHRQLKQCLLNQRLSPSQLAGEKGFQLWMNYMKTWYDLNIAHVQFNMVDNETLRAAQVEPEKYQELIVRVAGYSAHFVELNALTQEGIIERTIQEI